MTFRQFIYRNVVRNKRLYAAFFFSSLFSVLVFFVYAIFAFHPSLSDDNINSSVAIGLHTAEAIIYVFAIFFVLYSLSSFLKSRKKEFGLLVMHGMTAFQLRRMVFMENVLIGLFSTLGGLGLGLLFAKAILMAAEKLLRLEHSLPFYWPQQAILLTFGSFMLLFCIISLFTVVTVRSRNVIELLKGSAAPKSEPRASLLLSLLAALLLGSGYVGAMITKGLEVVAAFVPVTILVILGTYFLFTQFSVYAMKRLKRNPAFYWRRTNMLTLSDLTYRMKDNARTFFLVSIVSTVAFTAIGSLICFGAVLTRQMDTGMPFELQYRYSMTSGQTADAQSAAEQAHSKNIEQIRTYLQQHSPGYKETRVGIGTFETTDGNKQLVPLSAYNEAAKLTAKEEFQLSSSEAIIVHNSRALLGYPADDALIPITSSGTDKAIKPIRITESGAVPMFTTYYIVSDELYASLGAAVKQELFYFWLPTDSSDLLQIGQQLIAILGENDAAGSGYFASKAYNTDELLRSYSIVLFIGLFIGVVFFIAAGSFLYFRMYQDLEDDLRKFSMIGKLGLTSGELSRVVSRQMMLLFFAPVAVALIHGAVALNALQNMFMEPLLKEASLVLGCFLLIQLGYYVFARHFYIQRMLRVTGA